MHRSLLRGAVLAFVILTILGTGGSVSQAALPTNFADQLVCGGLSQPVGFDFLPDGRILVIEQRTANVHVVVAGAPTLILTVPNVNISGGERGLLGVAVDPDWPARPYVYFYYDQTPSIKCYISMYTASGDLSNPISTNLTLSNRFHILTDIPDDANNHNGGTLRFGPDGMLYASLGEDADPCGAQELSALKGVILRLNVASLPQAGNGPPAKSVITPPDNPFSGNVNAALVWAYGLRNPFRFHIDPEDGKVFIADVGQTLYEEVDECRGGENFGWPHYEGPSLRGSACPPATHTPPIAYYDRSALTLASIISATVYKPMPGGVYNFPPEYYGDYFFCEYYVGFVRHIRNSRGTWSAPPMVPGQPNADDWATSLTNVSEWLVGPDGGLYYCKQFASPSIRRIVYTANPVGVGEGSEHRPPVVSVYPNPYSRRAGNLRIDFSTGGGGGLRLDVFDVAGRFVRDLVAGSSVAGSGTIQWDGTDQLNRPVPPGVYFLKLQSGDRKAGKRLVLSER